MKIIALVTVMILAGCIAEISASTTEQDICRDDPDRCPGGHPITHEEYTRQEAHAQYPDADTTVPAQCTTLNDGRWKCQIFINYSYYVLAFQCQENSPGGSVTCSGSIQ